MKTHFLIGAANSGAGKTTLTIGLLRVLKEKGLKVQSFKCGPDYIDTRYHAAAAHTEPVNLDTWMASEEHVRNIYRQYSATADCCVTEGVMGLFDGYSKMHGSSAEIAALLNIPVILVMNAVSTAYSVAPVIYGFMHFHPEVRIAGVIFNKVSSASHFSFLKEACEDIGIECFGYMPINKDISIPSRHLGLNIDDTEAMENYICRIADMVRENIDVEHLIESMSVDDQSVIIKESLSNKNDLTIAVAHDEAFNFTYRVNIDALKQLGNVITFSPLHDKSLPEADIIYIPGGYPELYALQLSDNKSMLSMIKDYASNGGKIFAECGGMMYLCRSMTVEGDKYNMCDILPLDSTMDGARLTLGYRTMTYNGIHYKGHEFHYSHLTDATALPTQTVLYNARDMEVPVRLYRVNNVIAGYTHWYWGENDFMNFWK